MNLAALLRQQAHSRPDKPAIEYRGETWSYRECWRRVEGLAAALHARGVGAGDRVGSCLGDHPEHVLLHFALARLGACLVPLDHRWSPAEKEAAAGTFRVAAIVTDGQDAGIGAATTIPLAALREDPRAPLPPESAAGDAPFAISLSSGTTGRPKGAIVTHEQMLERFIAQWVTIGFSTADRFILVSPLFFGAGRSFSMSLLAAGATLILSPPPHEPDALRRSIVASAATATFLVPTMMRRLLALPVQGPMFPGLRRLLISGEAFHPDEVEQFRSRLSPSLIGYYATSEGGGISVLQPEDFASRGDTVGQAAFRIELEIVDADGPVAVGETGRLRYRGPGISRRLLDEHGQEIPGAADGWFYPGDLASIDEQGYVTLRGREKDVIIRGGVNVYPAEIERVVAAHPLIREAAVVGVPSASHGEAVVACIATVGDAGDEELAEYCRQRLAPYKLPARWLRFDSLPRAGSGKIDKKALKRIAAQEP